MRVPDRDAAAIVRAVFHEMRSRVGTVRLAITTLQENASHRGVAEELLLTADRETLRLSADMVGAAALVQCLVDRSGPVAVDVGDALRRAASRARERGVAARARPRTGTLVRARSGSLEAALAALMQLVADGGGEAVASTALNGQKVLISITAAAGASSLGSSVLATSLVDALGGTLVPSEQGIALELPGARG